MRDAVTTAGANRGARNAFQFYAIALGLALGVRLLAPALGHASLAATMATPAVAAAIMLVFVAPEGGLRASLAGLGLTAFGLRGWPLALLGPALIFAVGLAVLAALGLTTLAAPAIEGSGAGVAVNLLAGFIAGTLFALCEEIGWRGYMLPHMRGFGAGRRDADRRLPARRLAPAVAADHRPLSRGRRSPGSSRRCSSSP